MKIVDYIGAAVASAVYGDGNAVSYPCLGLADEWGEYVEKVEDVNPVDFSSDEKKAPIVKELGDVFWYWAATVRDLGFDYGEIVDLASGLGGDLTFDQLEEASRSTEVAFPIEVYIGRLCGIAKKALRDNGGIIQAEKLEVAKQACVDILLSFMEICRVLDVSPSFVATANIMKLQARVAAGTVKGDGDNR